jgi:hypothetical protein
MTDHRDPARLREDAGLRALLDSASLDDDPAAVARVGAKLGIASVPVAPGPTPPAPIPASVGAAGAAASGLWKIAALFAVAAGLATVVVLGATTTNERPHGEARIAASTPRDRGADDDSPVADTDYGQRPDTQSEPGVVLSPPSPEAPASIAGHSPHADRPSSPRPRAHAGPVLDTLSPDTGEETTATGTLAAEIRLVERIRSAIATDPELALQLAEQHRTEFPDGRLRTERERLEERARVAESR